MVSDREIPVSIDWEILSKAVSYYRRLNFKYVEVPWMVSQWASRVTCPPHGVDLETRVGGTFWGCPVASAEQSFLHMVAEGRLPPGRYCTLTPCFREEPSNEWHFKHFMKVELFDNTPTPLFRDMVSCAAQFFRPLLPIRERLFDDGTIDIESLQGIELGSYGQRTCQLPNGGSLTWAYGTGVAEPRFSQAVGLSRSS